jgi:hypothetical protein
MWSTLDSVIEGGRRVRERGDGTMTRKRIWHVTARSTRRHHTDVAAILRNRHREAEPLAQALTGPPH